MITNQNRFLKKDYINQSYTVVDNSSTSLNYFDITELPTAIGGGRSVIRFKGNPNNLKRYEQVDMEVVDAAGNAVRTEFVDLIDRFGNYYGVITVYPETAQGKGTISLVGEATRDLNGRDISKGAANDLGFNLIWTKSIEILPFERNNSQLIFNNPPQISVAQIVTPARISNQLASQNIYAATTSSNMIIVTSNFKGYDKKSATSKGVIDLGLVDIKINPSNNPSTTNIVNTLSRTTNADVVGGNQINDFNRFNTVVSTTVPFFSSSHVGGFLQFFTESYTLERSIPANATPANTNPYNLLKTIETQSIDEQLSYWTSTIVRVKNDTTAYIERPLQVNVETPQANNRGFTTSTHTYHQATNFTSSLVYVPNSTLSVTSSLLSQSYIQFTYQDLAPIAGEVYKIRTYYKRSSATQDWTILNDQVVYPPEYLTDAEQPNRASYARSVSDYLLIGHFTEQSIFDNNWSLFNEPTTGFDTTTGSITSTVLQDSIQLQTTATYNKILTTKYYQTYLPNQTYSAAANCILAPYTQVEFYMNSSTLGVNVIDQPSGPIAFSKTKNYEKARYPENYNRFGKFIGRVTNNTNSTVDYGSVVFDFLTDSDGLGRPLIRTKPITASYTGSAHLSKLSITPQKLNGFTPNIIQYAAPAPVDFNYHLSESLDYKFEYYDYTGRQSEYVTYLNDVILEQTSEIPTNKCQSEYQRFTFTPEYYVSCSSANGIIGLKQTDNIFTDPYTTSIRFYPAFTNGLVGTFLGSYAGAVVSRTPVDGWNAAIPFNELTPTSATYAAFQYISASISYTNQTVYQNANGRVTSSWRWYDTFTSNFNTGPGYGTALSFYGYLTSSVSTIDNAIFTTHSSVGITRDDVSQSYADFATAANNALKTVALKKRRLVWPTGGAVTSSYFTENGGIYNVKFKLKKTTNYIPDSGSFAMVYIHNAFANYTTSRPGTSGWYPPTQNIVKIGHAYSSGSITTPSISWYDSATGFYYDEYNINVVQYGSPAQLVFESGGENDKYFGTLIDDIEFCKVGVTTDPTFIKPQAIANPYLVSSNSSPYLPQR